MSEKDCAIRSANQICIISVETTFETHLSSCKKYLFVLQFHNVVMGGCDVLCGGGETG